MKRIGGTLITHTVHYDIGQIYGYKYEFIILFRFKKVEHNYKINYDFALTTCSEDTEAIAILRW